MRSIVFNPSKYFAAVLTALILVFSADGQSTDQNFPSPVTSNEITGRIKARDIGDSRLTRYFYALDGNQGDIFINLVTTNLEGTVDVFTVEGLHALTKMVVYADSNSSETGRLIYLRKPEHLLVRIEGRTLNDDPATFRIKFAGSFVASKPGKVEEAPKVTEAGNPNEPGVRVNSVGTIIAVIPKPPPPVKTVPEKKEETPKAERKTETAKTTKKVPVKKRPELLPEEKTETTAKEAAIPEEPKETVSPKIEKPEEKKAEPTAARSTANRSKTKTTVTAKPKVKEPKSPSPPKETPPDPLAQINLIIEFKDGKVIERPMSEVSKFSVDKGILVVVAKDGTIGRYSILDVAKVTIQ